MKAAPLARAWDAVARWGGRAGSNRGSTGPGWAARDPSLPQAVSAVVGTVFATELDDADLSAGGARPDVTAALATLVAARSQPLAQAALVVAGLHGVSSSLAVRWGDALAELAVSLPRALHEDGVPREPGREGGTAPTEDLATLLGALAMARIAARRAGAPFPAALDRSFAAGAHYLAARTGVSAHAGTSAAPGQVSARADTWRDPSFLHALACAWGLAVPGHPRVLDDPRLARFGVVPRAPGGGTVAPAGDAPDLPRRATPGKQGGSGRARAPSVPTWDVHAFQDGGVVVARAHGAPQRVVADRHDLSVAWERGAAFLVEGSVPGLTQVALARARVDGRRLAVEAEGSPADATPVRHRRTLHAQPGRLRVTDRLDDLAPDDASHTRTVRLRWSFGSAWAFTTDLPVTAPDTPFVELRAVCGQEELRVQLPAAVRWTSGQDARGATVLEGTGLLAAGAPPLVSTFETRALSADP